MTIDQGSIIKGILLPRTSIADEIADADRQHLFGNATLQDLPSDNEGPRFVINATNVQTNVLWRSSKPFMGDYPGGANQESETGSDPSTSGDLQFEPYTSEVILTDGGVYDNLGLETAWKGYRTILFSDGGVGSSDEPKPKREWLEIECSIYSTVTCVVFANGKSSAHTNLAAQANLLGNTDKHR